VKERFLIYFFLIVEKYVNLNTLGAELASKYIYEYARSSLAGLLKNIGFSYKEDDNRRALMEKPHVRSLRKIFLNRSLYGQPCKSRR
jgi:transposase